MEQHHIAAGKQYLHGHRLLMRMGLSGASMFGWIFIFQYFLKFSLNMQTAFAGVLLIYALSHMIVIILTPISAAHLRHGVKRSMTFGALALAAAFIVLGATLAGFFAPLGWGIVLFGCLLGAYRALYWIPYRLQDTPSLLNHPNLFFELLVALMPAFAGLTIVMVPLGFLRLLFGAAALVMVSVIPILFLHEIHERFSWNYIGTYKRLFIRENGILVSRAVLDGIQSAALLLIWPLAVFLIVGGSYLVLGLIMSASFIVLLLLRGFYRMLTSAFGMQEWGVVDMVVVSSAWIFRLAAGTPIAVMLVDSYSFVGAPRGSSGAAALEHTADGSSYIDEYTALQEIGLGIGRIVTCMFAGVILIVAPLSVALTITIGCVAIAAAASVLLARKAARSTY